MISFHCHFNPGRDTLLLATFTDEQTETWSRYCVGQRGQPGFEFWSDVPAWGCSMLPPSGIKVNCRTVGGWPIPEKSH